MAFKGSLIAQELHLIKCLAASNLINSRLHREYQKQSRGHKQNDQQFVENIFKGF